MNEMRAEQAEVRAEKAKQTLQKAEKVAKMKTIFNDDDDNHDELQPAREDLYLSMIEVKGSIFPDKAEAFHTVTHLDIEGALDDAFFLKEADKGAAALKKTRLMQILGLSEFAFCRIQACIRMALYNTDAGKVREVGDIGLLVKDISDKAELELQEYPLIEFVLRTFNVEYFDKVLEQRASARYLYVRMAIQRMFEVQRAIIKVHDEAIDKEQLWSAWTIAKPVLEEAISEATVRTLKLDKSPQKRAKLNEQLRVRILLSDDDMCVSKGKKVLEIDFTELDMIFGDHDVDWNVQLPLWFIVEQAYDQLVVAFGDGKEGEPDDWALAWFNECTPFGQEGFIAINTTYQAAHALHILQAHYAKKLKKKKSKKNVEYLSLWLVSFHPRPLSYSMSN